MKNSKYTEQQVAFVLKHAELGPPVEEVELRLRQLEKEDNKLKRLVTDLSLKKTGLQDNRCRFLGQIIASRILRHVANSGSRSI